MHPTGQGHPTGGWIVFAESEFHSNTVKVFVVICLYIVLFVDGCLNGLIFSVDLFIERLNGLNELKELENIFC